MAGFATPGHAGDVYCDALASKLDPGVPYAASCADAKCLTELSAIDVTHLRPNQRTIVYRSSDDAVRNSLVVVQTKYLKADLNDPALPHEVALQRDAIGFVCSGSKVGPIPATRSLNATEYERQSYAVDLERYQKYHLRGFLDGEDGRFLDRDFHVVYYNGARCVASNQGVRRQQFLMYDRGGILSPFSSFLARIFLSPSVAVAAPADFHKYASLAIRVIPYRGVPDKPSCVSFRVHADSSGLDLVIDDLEQKASFADALASGSLFDWQIAFDQQ